MESLDAFDVTDFIDYCCINAIQYESGKLYQPKKIILKSYNKHTEMSEKKYEIEKIGVKPSI